jgi:hypothetical protein
MPEVAAFIFDRRYSAPTLRLVVSHQAGEQASLAQSILQESPWHSAVEIRVDDQMVVAVTREDPAVARRRGSGELNYGAQR